MDRGNTHRRWSTPWPAAALVALVTAVVVAGFAPTAPALPRAEDPNARAPATAEPAPILGKGNPGSEQLTGEPGVCGDGCGDGLAPASSAASATACRTILELIDARSVSSA